MKKIILISIAALVVLVIGALLYAASNANSIIASFKHDIEAAASEALGSNVKLGALSVSVFPNAIVKVDKFTLKQTGSEGLSLNNLALDISLLPLLSGELKINKFYLNEPSIRLISGKNGSYIDGLKTSKKKKTKISKAQAQGSKTDQQNEMGSVPIALNLESFSVKNATIEILNKEKETSRKLSNINLDSTLKLSPENKSASFDSNANLKLENEEIDSDFKLNANKQKIDIPVLKIEAFGGNVNGKITSALTGSKSLNAEFTLAELDAQRAFNALNPKKAGMIEGSLDKFDIKLQGSTQGSIPKSLNGNAEILFTEGSVNGFNLVKEVLKEISELPFFRDRLMSAVPEEQKDEIVSENTAIESLTGTFNIGSQKLTTNNLNVLSTIFSLKGQGSVNFQGELALDAQLVFNKAFSTGIAGKIKEAKHLLNENEELVIPLALVGVAPDIQVRPDMKALAKLGVTKEIAEKASELLGDKGKDIGKIFGF